MLAITKQAEIRMLEFLEKRDIPMTQCFRLSGPPQGAKLSIDSYSDEDRVFHRNDRCILAVDPITQDACDDLVVHFSRTQRRFRIAARKFSQTRGQNN